ncbi:erg1 [Acrasis kona]|uniref:Erg1 n=1 Tax=Acrasis kona TaxID=1008807 RepID=A0AAW2ZCZ6_9EUKA
MYSKSITKSISIIGNTPEAYATALFLKHTVKDFKLNVNIINKTDTKNKDKIALLSPRVCSALNDLGLLEKVRAKGSIVENYYAMSRYDYKIGDISFQDSFKPTSILHSDLIKILREAVRSTPSSSVVAHTINAGVTDVSKKSDNYSIVTTASTHNRNMETDLIVCADGYDSQFRDKFFKIKQELPNTNQDVHLIMDMPDEFETNMDYNVIDYYGNRNRFCLVPISEKKLGIISRSIDLLSKVPTQQFLLHLVVQVHGGELVDIEIPSVVLARFKEMQSKAPKGKDIENLDVYWHQKRFVQVEEDVVGKVVAIGEVACSTDDIMFQEYTIGFDDAERLATCIGESSGDFDLSLEKYKKSSKSVVTEAVSGSLYFKKLQARTNNVFTRLFYYALNFGERHYTNRKLKNMFEDTR